MKIKKATMAVLIAQAAVYGGLYSTPASATRVHESIPVTHGVASGDVRSDSAVIWSRTDQEAVMHVVIRSKDVGHYTVPVSAERDYTGKVFVEGLRPDTEYRYKIWFGASENDWRGRKQAVRGNFHTPPKPNEKEEVSFAWGGDLAGQNVCRDVTEGFPIFQAINELELNFFIGLGDMIYADGVCEELGRYGNLQVPGNFIQAADMENYWAHWKYNREDEGYRKLLANMPYYALWDDHEVVNDFGPLHDTRNMPPYTPGAHLLPLGRAALLDYNPIREQATTLKRLYRNIRWGRHLELFILDNRQYRDANLEPDDPVFIKTMLGREQLVWLKEKLMASNATWKVIVSGVPMSIPTGFPPELGRDGWANFDQDTGFENELMDILCTLRQQEKRNVVWITTDVHFAEVFRYTPFLAEDPGFQVYEFVTGPLNAGLFPNPAFDTTFNTESLFFYGPPGGDSGLSYEQAKPWMNFGVAEVDEAGNLQVSIRDVSGTVVYETTLQPD